MITPEEIKVWLATEIAVHYHLPNPEPRLAPKEFMYLEKMHGETLAYIERLEADNESKQKRINELESHLAQAKRERDAAVHDLNAFALNSEKELACDFCGAASPLICQQCEERPDGFKWRGVCEENTNDQP